MLKSLTLAAAFALVAATPSQLAQITERGRFLAAYDQAAWHASDLVMGLAGSNTSGLDLFIAHKDADVWTVDFGALDAAGTSFLTVYEAQSHDDLNFTARRFSPARADTGFLVNAAHAIKTAEAHFVPVPNRRYNVAVLPNDDGTMYVYLYPAQTVANIYPIGGDERYKTSADGTTILDDHRMHKSILDIAGEPSGSAPSAEFHTDIYSDVPEDTDVFHVLASKPPMPNYVVANGNVFLINPDGTIEAKGTVHQ